MGRNPLGIQDVVHSHNATLTWDAENRLIKVVTHGGDTIQYDYDYLSRRISKTVDLSSAGGNGIVITNYLHEGWYLMEQFSGETLNRKYTWGMDLSGTRQGAGGVGGLLSDKDESVSPAVTC